MDTENLKLTAGQLNDSSKFEEPYEYVAPIDFVTSAYLYHGKLKTISDVNDFISRNLHYGDVIKKKVAYLMDTGAISVDSKENFIVDYSKSWHAQEDPSLSLRTVPDVTMLVSKRGLIDRLNNTKESINFSKVFHLPDTVEVNQKLLKILKKFNSELSDLFDEIEKENIKSDNVRGFIFGSGLIKEGDF